MSEEEVEKKNDKGASLRAKTSWQHARDETTGPGLKRRLQMLNVVGRVSGIIGGWHKAWCNKKPKVVARWLEARTCKDDDAAVRAWLGSEHGKRRCREIMAFKVRAAQADIILKPTAFKRLVSTP